MRKTLRSFVLLACIASTTAFGSQIVLADDDAAATIPSQAQGHHQRHHQRHGDSFRKLAKELGFTELQKTQLKAIHTNNQVQAKLLFVNLLTAKHGLQTLIQSGTADAAAINAQTTLVATAETNMAVLRAQEYTQFVGLLTPTQVTTLDSVQAAREAKFQKLLARVSNGSQQ